MKGRRVALEEYGKAEFTIRVHEAVKLAWENKEIRSNLVRYCKNMLKLENSRDIIEIDLNDL